ncbi:segregation and condensation protein A [Paenibacillus bovis]|uniref:Segregation and condensation protein A n=1 Tax=Paenibacillus bovis TaxID=1616788 RepID=A0A172ZIM0_9BACL|nr:segregation/condensation protein A [Paenibacillus bovis]ANF97484.1 segregation/condensation protein A [Paenibacillus bovis]
MTVLYKLETFEGPLDLLLHLIDESEIDIQNIPISEITEQYLEYLHSMKELELEVTSEFLVMAATLLSIKSKLLLPRPPVMEMDDFDYYEEEDLDPRAELVRKLVEYRKYKGIAGHLREREEERSLIFTKEPEDLKAFTAKVNYNPVEGLHTMDLVEAFRKALRRASRRTQITRIQRDEISVKDRIRQVASRFLALEKGENLLFSKLLDQEMYRHEIVVTFLAILEMMKMKQIACYQSQLFDDIVMEWRGEISINEVPEVESSY